MSEGEVMKQHYFGSFARYPEAWSLPKRQLVRWPGTGTALYWKTLSI